MGVQTYTCTRPVNLRRGSGAQSTGSHPIETLVVIPFWEEIDRFNRQAREALRRRGRLGSEEVSRESVRPLDWTEEQKVHWHAYHKGDWWPLPWR